MQCRCADTGPSTGKGAFSSCGPVSAAHRFALHRARDDRAFYNLSQLTLIASFWKAPFHSAAACSSFAAS